MQKKKMRILSAALLLAVFMVVTACSSNQSQEAKEDRTEGIRAMAQGSYGKAQDLFEQALEKSSDPKTSSGLDNYYYKAIAQFNSGDEDGAIATYSELIKADAKNADAYFLRGNVYLSKQDAGSAETDFGQALQIDPNDLSRRICIYESYRKYGQEEKGKDQLQYVLNHEGEDYLNGAKAKDYLGQTDAAVSDYQAAVRAGKNEAYRPLIALLDRQQKREEADTALEEYRQKKLSGEDYHNIVGIQLDRAAYEDARSDVDRALELKGLKEGEKRKLLADQVACLEHLRQYDEAKTRAEAYLKLYPTDGQMIRELKLIEYAQKPVQE
ncbi:tetratricopeptide repeat protein [Shuttleworthella sp. MSX8B]|uniref:tetratricopeptide repeat protein n=1 Tax=Shuttleworthella sp. MSX8B TaxID=936574 RepID=UPI00044C7B57|nr:tetratricopeptide repeat protein [Shuttleworthia sp. MSX8B]EUB14622.1 tetratricopeptide repeat protein [Shuttleworthia sp. MSX8B]